MGGSSYGEGSCETEGEGRSPIIYDPQSLWTQLLFSVKEAEFKDLGVFQICKRRWRPSVIKRPIRCCSIFEENWKGFFEQRLSGSTGSLGKVILFALFRGVLEHDAQQWLHSDQPIPHLYQSPWWKALCLVPRVSAADSVWHLIHSLLLWWMSSVHG